MKVKQFPQGTPLLYSLFVEKKLPLRYKIKLNKIYNKNIFRKSENFVKHINPNLNTKIKKLNYNNKNYYLSVFDTESIPGTYETIIKNLPKNINILDLGCGDKHAGRIFESLGNKVHFSDVKKLNINNFTQLDFNSVLPFKNKEFDYVISIDVIEHLENPYLFLREVNRITKNGFFISTPNVVLKKSKSIFLKKGYFSWFEPKELDFHIMPIFPWQIKKFCKEAKLNLKILGNFNFFKKRSNPFESESLIFKITK